MNFKDCKVGQVVTMKSHKGWFTVTAIGEAHGQNTRVTLVDTYGRVMGTYVVRAVTLLDSARWCAK